MLEPEPCPLCQHLGVDDFHRDKHRQYWRCQRCELVFVGDHQLLSDAAEKAEYDKHQNNADDPGYRAFLNRCLAPLLARLSPGACGLDFGSGPGPTLSLMAKEQGFSMVNYDPFYANEPGLLQRQYDFITLTEVIEHVRQPREVFQQLNHMLAPTGRLAVMTKQRDTPERFANWHYKNDPTHIRFYHRQSFEYIGALYDWQIEWIDNDVVFFHRAGAY